MDLARPPLSYLPGDEFCERAICCDHGVPPLWPITWTSPPCCEPASPLVPPNNKGHILPIEVRRLEKHGCEIDIIQYKNARIRNARTVLRAREGAVDALREAVTTLDETTRTARRVMGGAHPLTVAIEDDLRDARAALAARETPPSPPARSV